jgi:hypothetical protein
MTVAPDAPKEVSRHKATTQYIRNILTVIAVVGIPAVVTLNGIRVVPGEKYMGGDTTPYGYTISLLLFFVPLVVFAQQLLGKSRLVVDHRPLVYAAGTIALIGFTLDVAFGYSFFTFANQGATLGIRLPSWNFATQSFHADYLPVEEFAFYILGALFMLTLYRWIEDKWLDDAAILNRAAAAGQLRRLVGVNKRSLAVWFAAVAVGLVYKRYLGSQGWLPGYYLFVMLLGFLPTVLFLDGIQNFVNWRAFSMAYSILLFIELLWETTLAIPFGWWDYQDPMMLGIRAKAWHNLPLEAVLLWLVIAWDCIIALEIFRVYFAKKDAGNGSVAHALFGLPHASAAAPPSTTSLPPAAPAP